MDGFEAKSPSRKLRQYSLAAQVCLRSLATAASLAAAWIMFANKQCADVFGIPFDARYSYFTAFEYFAIANLFVCIFSLLSLVASILLARSAGPNIYYYMFLHDLVMLILVISGSAAATAIGMVGKYGNTHTGWIKLCDTFDKFCDRTVISFGLSYLCCFLYLLLVVISVIKSRNTRA
ncbi:hypothetical protein NMG60_11004676 [Bertholletia excelsa]